MLLEVWREPASIDVKEGGCLRDPMLVFRFLLLAGSFLLTFSLPFGSIFFLPEFDFVLDKETEGWYHVILLDNGVPMNFDQHGGVPGEDVVLDEDWDGDGRVPGRDATGRIK